MFDSQEIVQAAQRLVASALSGTLAAEFEANCDKALSSLGAIADDFAAELHASLPELFADQVRAYRQRAITRVRDALRLLRLGLLEIREFVHDPDDTHLIDGMFLVQRGAEDLRVLDERFTAEAERPLLVLNMGRRLFLEGAQLLAHQSMTREAYLELVRLYEQEIQAALEAGNQAFDKAVEGLYRFDGMSQASLQTITEALQSAHDHWLRAATGCRAA